jgi:hypothetical protein
MADKLTEDRLKEYSERHRFWTDKAYGQLSLSIEIIFGLSIATLGYLLDKKDDFAFCWCLPNCVFSLTHALLFTSVSFIMLSIVFGLLAIMSRNLDLRITRHITYLRKKKSGVIKNEPTIKLPCLGYCGLLKIFIEGYRKIEPSEYDSPEFVNRFSELRWMANCLGQLTWNSSKWQIIFLFFGILQFVVYRFI